MKNKINKAVGISLLLGALLVPQGLTAQRTIVNQNTPRGIFTDRVLNTFAFLYDGLKREIPLCMEALKFDNTYLIYNTTIPYMIESNDSTSTFDLNSCKTPNYVGIAHNHYRGLCQPDRGDVARFEADEDAVLEVVVCRGVSRKESEIDFFTLTRNNIVDYKWRQGYY